MKNVFIILLFIFGSTLCQAQKFSAEKSKVSFFSKAAIENITAVNTSSTSILNSATQEIVFVIPIAAFKFPKKLMQEHFNEKYLESEKFPKATFQGKIVGFDPKAMGEQHAVAKGTLTIHGVAKAVEIPGTIEVIKSKVALKTKFMIKLADYNITIPTLMFQKIAEEVEASADFTYKPL